MLSKELLDILVCPVCKGDLETTDEHASLLCYSCNLKYPVRDGIPILLVNEAGACDE